MPELKPLDDNETYLGMANKAYNKKLADAIVNPKRRLAEQEAQAMDNTPAPATAASAPASGPKFTKGFTPAERAAQAKALQVKLANRKD